MQKKLTIIAGAVIVLGLGAVGGTYYLGQKNLESKQEQFKQIMDKIGRELPPGATQENNITENGLFESKGVYKLKYNHEKDNEVLTIDYTVNHGLSSYFSGDMTLDVVGKLEGTLTKDLKFNGDFLKTTGDLLGDGSFNLNTKMSGFSFEDKDGKIIVADSTDNLKYDSTTGKINTTHEIPNIKFSEMREMVDPDTIAKWSQDTSPDRSPTPPTTKKQIEALNIQGLKLTRNFNVSTPNLGDFTANVASIKMPTAQANNINIHANAELVNKKYNIKAGLKLDKLTSQFKKDDQLSLDFAYSVNGLNADVINYYHDLYKKYQKTGKLEDQNTQEIKDNFLKLVQTGAILNVEKFKIQDNKNTIELNGKIEIASVPDVKSISLEKNTKVTLGLNGQGEFARGFIAQFNNQKLLSNDLPLDDTKPAVKLDVTYNNGELVINKETINKPEIVTPLQTGLNALDVALGVAEPKSPTPDTVNAPQEGVPMTGEAPVPASSTQDSDTAQSKK